MGSWGSYQVSTLSPDPSTPGGAPPAPAAYYGSAGPSLPHLVAFTLATIGVAFILGIVRMLLLYCRHRRADRLRRQGNIESGNIDLHSIWQQHLHQQSLQQSSAESAGKDQRIQVMVVQPGNEVAIGRQIPDPEQPDQADLKQLSHKDAAAKLVDEASARDASRQTSSS